ncbi:MAG: alpha/beta hydrolase [Romboutsia sp.]
MNFENTYLTIKSFDDINLHYKKNIIDSPKAVILILHGLAEHSGRYEYTTKKLNSFGYSVYRYDHRGHGMSDGKRGFLKDTDNLVEDTNGFIDLIKSENPNIPIFMLGHSVGGHVLAEFGSKYKNKINGMIFSSPLICDTIGLCNFDFNNIDPYALVAECNSHDLTHDINAMTSYESDFLILENITLGMYCALNKSCKNIKDKLENFNYPCFIIHGSSDTVVSCEDSKFLYEHIASIDKELKILNGLYHKLLDEIVKDEILYEISKWIECILSRKGYFK